MTSGYFSFKKTRRLVNRVVVAFGLMIFGHVVISLLPLPPVHEVWEIAKDHFDLYFLLYVMAGFVAQLVDGILGMGYGVTSASFLMTMGVNPVAMSAAIHSSEIFTSGASGYSHYRFGNVNKKLFRHIVIPGIAGAVAGALFLVFLGKNYGSWLLPLISLYAGFLGLKIFLKAFKTNDGSKKVKRVGWLAGAGGFFDSFGSGGWGPIVTSTLISKGRSPKYTIGTVSLTEFFVTLSSSLVFFITIGLGHWNIILGLMTGGMIAAPLAARLTGRLPRKTMMMAVGIMVMLWSVRMMGRYWVEQ